MEQNNPVNSTANIVENSTNSTANSIDLGIQMKKGFKNIFNFKGRSSRMEFWCYFWPVLMILNGVKYAILQNIDPTLFNIFVVASAFVILEIILFASIVIRRIRDVSDKKSLFSILFITIGIQFAIVLITWAMFFRIVEPMLANSVLEYLDKGVVFFAIILGIIALFPSKK